MSRTNSIPSDVIAPDDPRSVRLERERRLIEEARVSVAAGHVVPDGEVDAWLDHMVESDEPMPIPGDRRSIGSR